jgi:hypothetical protein
LGKGVPRRLIRGKRGWHKRKDGRKPPLDADFATPLFTIGNLLMATAPSITIEELRRAESWLICLHDALAYIALANQTDAFVTENAMFNYAEGSRRGVAHTIEKGLISAAIVSAGQVFKGGDAGTGIAHNHTAPMVQLRALLFKCSDEANSLSEGESEKMFNALVRDLRDGFISHFDGGKANIVELNANGNAISWRPPNPDFIVEAFVDLEKVLYQMHRSLHTFTTQERWAFHNLLLEK